MRKDDRQLLIEILIKNNLLNPALEKKLEEEERQTGKNLFDLIEEKEIVPEEVFAKIKSKLFGIPYIDLREKKIEKGVLELIPVEVASNYKILAFKRVGDEVGIAMTRPQDIQAGSALDFIARKLNIKINYFITSKSSLEKGLESYESMKEDVQEALHSAAADIEVETTELSGASAGGGADTSTTVKTAPVSKMVSVILRNAIEGKASDIHIEPVGNETRVRYRVDGVLNTSLVLPKNVHAAIIARIKVLANLKLDESRLPQDGRFRMSLEGRYVDFRVSTMPLLDQEKVAIRILDSAAQIYSLENLGFSGRNLELMKLYLKRPHGMFLVTGPTGSGKSTTLYTLLEMLNQEGVNIITLEDPIEYYVNGVNQSQIRPEIGLSFANGLRSILRQDPDVIMVGEIRDDETAELAVHASLTGHIVLSTLHTNDALGAVPRLMDMKVEPFLIASSLNLVVAQRLVRRICSYCRETNEVPEHVIAEVKTILESIPKESIPPDIDKKSLTFYRGKTCSRCENSGYKGRVAISEVLEITDNLKQMIGDGTIKNQQLMEEEVKRQGMIPMKADGILKALAGVTTVEEVFTVTKE